MLVLLVLFAGCEKKEILPEEKFIEVYVDILVAEDTTAQKSFSSDSLKTIVLSKHNTTEIVYQNTIDYYNESPDRWEKFFDEVVTYVEKLKSKSEE